MSLSTKIGNLNIDTCIYNAAGVRSTNKKDLLELSRSEAGIVLTKSCTKIFNEGNSNPKYYYKDNISLNSIGISNWGYEYYLNLGKQINNRKPYFISVNASNIDECLFIVKNINDSNNVKGIELNVSCPNIINGSQIAYDFEKMEELVKKIKTEIRLKKVLGLKLPTYLDNSHFDKVAEIINKYSLDFITCINCIGKGMIIDDETTVIVPNYGIGGLGGCIKPIALANVSSFFNRVECTIIGCGGIKNGRDAFEHILAGASAVQIGTQLYENGPSFIRKVKEELLEIMEEKNYNKIEDFRGRLKFI